MRSLLLLLFPLLFLFLGFLEDGIGPINWHGTIFIKKFPCADISIFAACVSRVTLLIC